MAAKLGGMPVKQLVSSVRDRENVGIGRTERGQEVF
jgi:hypothetical protein